jgi:hypothetical protein
MICKGSLVLGLGFPAKLVSFHETNLLFLQNFALNQNRLVCMFCCFLNEMKQSGVFRPRPEI